MNRACNSDVFFFNPDPSDHTKNTNATQIDAIMQATFHDYGKMDAETCCRLMQTTHAWTYQWDRIMNAMLRKGVTWDDLSKMYKIEDSDPSENYTQDQLNAKRELLTGSRVHPYDDKKALTRLELALGLRTNPLRNKGDFPLTTALRIKQCRNKLHCVDDTSFLMNTETEAQIIFLENVWRNNYTGRFKYYSYVETARAILFRKYESKFAENDWHFTQRRTLNHWYTQLEGYRTSEGGFSSLQTERSWWMAQREPVILHSYDQANACFFFKAANGHKAGSLASHMRDMMENHPFLPFLSRDVFYADKYTDKPAYREACDKENISETNKEAVDQACAELCKTDATFWVTLPRTNSESTTGAENCQLAENVSRNSVFFRSNRRWLDPTLFRIMRPDRFNPHISDDMFTTQNIHHDLAVMTLNMEGVRLAYNLDWNNKRTILIKHLNSKMTELQTNKERRPDFIFTQEAYDLSDVCIDDYEQCILYGPGLKRKHQHDFNSVLRLKTSAWTLRRSTLIPFFARFEVYYKMSDKYQHECIAPYSDIFIPSEDQERWKHYGEIMTSRVMGSHQLQHVETRRNITVGNVHLCGGRFDEPKIYKAGFMNPTDLHRLKCQPLAILIDDRMEYFDGADIILGDFNSDLNVQPLTDGISKDANILKEGVFERMRTYFEDWSFDLESTFVWHTAPYSFLVRPGGFKIAPEAAKFSENHNKTSVYGGFTDSIWIRYHNYELQAARTDQNSVDAYSFKKIDMEVDQEIKFKRPSDHHGVLAHIDISPRMMPPISDKVEFWDPLEQFNNSVARNFCDNAARLVQDLKTSKTDFGLLCAGRDMYWPRYSSDIQWFADDEILWENEREAHKAYRNLMERTLSVCAPQAAYFAHNIAEFSRMLAAPIPVYRTITLFVNATNKNGVWAISHFDVKQEIERMMASQPQLTACTTNKDLMLTMIQEQLNRCKAELTGINLENERRVCVFVNLMFEIPSKCRVFCIFEKFSLLNNVAAFAPAQNFEDKDIGVDNDQQRVKAYNECREIDPETEESEILIVDKFDFQVEVGDLKAVRINRINHFSPLDDLHKQIAENLQSCVFNCSNGKEHQLLHYSEVFDAQCTLTVSDEQPYPYTPAQLRSFYNRPIVDKFDASNEDAYDAFIRESVSCLRSEPVAQIQPMDSKCITDTCTFIKSVCASFNVTEGKKIFDRLEGAVEQRAIEQRANTLLEQGFIILYQQDSVKDRMFSDHIGPDHTIQLDGLETEETEETEGFTILSGNWDTVTKRMERESKMNVFEVANNDDFINHPLKELRQYAIEVSDSDNPASDYPFLIKARVETDIIQNETFSMSGPALQTLARLDIWLPPPKLQLTTKSLHRKKYVLPEELFGDDGAFTRGSNNEAVFMSTLEEVFAIHEIADWRLLDAGIMLARAPADAQTSHRDGPEVDKIVKRGEYRTPKDAVLIENSTFYAINVFIPLMNGATKGCGGTWFSYGSNTKTEDDCKVWVPCALNLNQCLMFDYRTMHYAIENPEAAETRPMLHLTYGSPKKGGQAYNAVFNNRKDSIKATLPRGEKLEKLPSYNESHDEALV